MKIKIIMMTCMAVVFASAAAQASDPCATTLCLAGKMEGQGGGASCSQPIADYFGIRVFGKHHSFDASGTADARSSFLNQCADGGANQSVRNSIGGAYGSLLNEP